jgi:hypothetical protein
MGDLKFGPTAHPLNAKLIAKPKLRRRSKTRLIMLLFRCVRTILLVFVAATPTHPSLEFIALFLRHLFPAVTMPTPMCTMATKSTEQYLAQQQHTHRLHVVDLFAAYKQCRNQPIP